MRKPTPSEAVFLAGTAVAASLATIEVTLKGDISTTERNWILKLWLVDKMQNQRHICNRVYKARPGDNQKWVKARERLHKVLDAYNVSYQVRSNSEVQVDFIMTPEQDFEFAKGQYHYINGGKKEDLTHPYARAGWEAEKFQREKQL